MSSYPRSQNLETGAPGQVRSICRFGEWCVEATDRNGVWVQAECGVSYASQAEAEAAAEGLREAILDAQ